MEVFLFVLLSLLATAVEGVSQKKGLAIPAQSYRCGDFDSLRGVAWWYDWTRDHNYHNPSECNSTVLANFVPMVWGRWWNHDLPFPEDTEYLLGFNEPNFYAQANICPLEAAVLWRQLEQQAGNRTLVSPAIGPCGGQICMSNGVDWMYQFMQACNGCRIDYLAAHGYWCDHWNTMGYLWDLWNRFHIPIWFTEFACPKKQSVADQLNYMKAVLPKLEETSYVYRYSWFATRVGNDGWVTEAVNLLELDSSNLTELGQYYMNF